MLGEENLFQNVLASLRVRRGWTQADAAAHIEAIGNGLNLRTYIKVETGQLPPSEKHLKLIVAGFKLNQADTATLYHAAYHTPPRIHNLPFPRNLLFTGRDTQLERLDQLLKENYGVALTGLAGIGKTQIALEYAHRCYVGKVYQAVFWVGAADEASLLTGYAKLAERLDLPERDEQNLGKIAQAVKEWLEQHTSWLLIIDNADNLQLARSFFPEVNDDNHGRILLTTRSQIVGNVAGEIIEIDKMEPAEGQLFLLRRSRRYGKIPDNTALNSIAADIRDAALQIVALLDGHPLALDQAGAYLEDNPLVSLTDYLNLYYEKRRELLSERGSLDEENEGKYSDHPESVVVTFELCFAKARERHPLATEILRFCAFLQPDAIPEELFQHDDDLKLDAEAFKKGIRALRRYSLLKINGQEKTCSIHRLVQVVLIDDISSDLQKQWRERVKHALNTTFPQTFNDWKLCDRLVPHITVGFVLSKDNQISGMVGTLIDAELFHKAGSYVFIRGHYQLAVVFFNLSYLIYKFRLGAEHPNVASVLCKLAYISIAIDMDGQAEQFLQEALAIQKSQLGDDHPDTISSLSLLATVYIRQEEFEKAEPLLIKLLSMGAKELVHEYPGIASNIFSYIILCFVQGKSEMAELLLQQLYKIARKPQGTDMYALTLLLYGTAFRFLVQGDYKQAAEFSQEADHIVESTLGADHPQVLKLKEFQKLLQSFTEHRAKITPLESNDELSE